MRLRGCANRDAICPCGRRARDARSFGELPKLPERQGACPRARTPTIHHQEPIWEQFRALLPEREVDYPLGCHRSRIPDRVVFEKLVQILVFGCAYRRIADEECSATTLRHHVLRMTDTNQRADNSSSSWRWNNIPLPEPHMGGILASAVLHLARPWRLRGNKRLHSGAGWILVGAGVAISASAVRTASDVDLERPSTLISSGPYAISRNPMYVGWTLLYLGGALITQNAWMVASLPVVAGLIHRDVLREEYMLERAFGKEYVRYRKLVRRYL